MTGTRIEPEASAKDNERGTAPPEQPASDADLVYEPADDGWPGHEEPAYTYH
jgi:hypothetical protein